MATSSAITATFCSTLVDEWIVCGVRHAVVAPGSRSTPMALALAERSELGLHVFHDERSAGFAALGIAKATGMPAILLCTSGTAAVEFHPAVVEAHHAEVPILVCTADRPPEMQGVGAPQTIEQRNLYGVAVRLFYNASVADDRQFDQWRDVARTMIVNALGVVPGPVHLNLQFREPLLGVATSLPIANSATFSLHVPDTVSAKEIGELANQMQNRRGIIVAGPDNYNSHTALNLAKVLGWPVFADPRSGCRTVENDTVIAAMDSILRDEKFASTHKPEIILRLGSPPASKVVNAWLASCNVPQTVLTTSSTLIDPELTVTTHLVGDISAACAALVTVIDQTARNASSSWLTDWGLAESKAQRAINETLANEPVLSEPAVARAVYGLLPEGSHLVVSSSMPIRDVEWYGVPRFGLTVHANRGVNGIDGVVSTAVGIALGTKAPTALLIGDIALLHDTNGLLTLMSRKVDLRIIVVDNRGGGIFSFLPQAEALSRERFEILFGTPHEANLEMLATAHGVPSVTVNSLDGLAESIALRGPYLTRIVTSREENVDVHERINQMVSASLRR